MADSPTPRDFVALIVACLALLGFGAFITYLLSHLGLEDKSWSRSLYLLNGVEAVAFAGAGFLFGREVNRGRAENAEKRAKHAEEKAQDANNLAAAVVESFKGAGESGVLLDQQRGTPAAGTPRVFTLALDVLRRNS